MRQDWRSYKGPLLSDEEVAWLLFNSAKRGAQARSLPLDIEYHDVLSLVRTGKCEISKIPFDKRRKPANGPDLPFRASLDRIDNTKGYLKNNVQVVCRIFNHCKWNWNTEDILQLATALVREHGEYEG